MRRPLSRSVRIAGLAVCGLLSVLAGPASGFAASNAGAAACDVPLSPRESLERVAQNIAAAGGTPTAAGIQFLNAAKSGDLSVLNAAGATKSGSGYSVQSSILATDATPINQPTVSDSRDPLGPRLNRAASSTLVNLNCGNDATANVIWYCRQGSTCTTRFYFWFGPPIPRTGSCPGAARYPCQVYATADPPPYDAVTYATLTQSAPGPPTVGDKWCSWA